jgi:hypothetical protein
MKIRKAGMHTLVAMIVIGFFILKTPEWTKGVQSYFIVYGQANSGTGATVFVTKVIPQIAVGSPDADVTKYKTVIQIVNEGTTAATVSGNFYNEDGTPSTLVLKTNLTSVPTVTGTFAFVTLPANGILTITADTAPSLTVNWAKIVSAGGTVTTSAYFDLTTGDGTRLYSRVGVPASDAGLSKFTIPRVRNVDAGLDVGFALVNTGTASAKIDATLRSSAGTVLSTKSLTLAAGAHTATFAKDFFALTGEGTGTNYSYMAFESSSAQFAATALAIEGGSLASFPVSTPVAGGSGTSLDVVDGSVTTGKLADGAVTGAKIASGQLVKSINSLKDDVTLTAGTNVTITPSGNTITISAASGGTTVAANPNVITESATPYKTALGSGALISNTAFGSFNTATGYEALKTNINGWDNTAIGFQALSSNDSSSDNTATGSRALSSTVAGGANTATGSGALEFNLSGKSNTASGYQALYSNQSGIENTASGARALQRNTTGNDNTAIGYFADVSAGNLNNATAIGYGATVNASNKIRLGNGAVTVIEGQVAYTYTSDKTKKENFQPVDAEGVLKKIQNLDVTSWNYIGNDPQQFRHYGPMAQDFFAAFGHDDVGTIGTPTTLTSGDIDGILMIAVKALQTENAQLKERLEKLEHFIGTGINPEGAKQ